MASSLSTALHASLSATAASYAATITTEALDPSRRGVNTVGETLLAIMKVVPSAIVWLAAFATFTLPAWLFTGLSTSLTFTVNMTTL